MKRTDSDSSRWSWLNRGVLGIILATFFSDVSHEMCTAVLPMFLVSIHLGPAALGLIEGVADLLVSLAKLGGGFLGHHVERKRPWTVLGYLITTTGTAAMGLVGSLKALVALRTVAWMGRGFRSPLRDFMLSDAVEPTHYGRAFGLERAGDMLGSVGGPLIASLMIVLGVSFRSVILWSLLPGLLAAACMWFLTRDRIQPHRIQPKGQADETAPASDDARPNDVAPQTAARFSPRFWSFLIGVFFFGMGDFSRTFLIWLAARSLGEDSSGAGGVLSIAVLLYAMHNLVSAVAAYPLGHLGDRYAKLPILLAGYGLGVVTNLLLAINNVSLPWLVVAIVFSGIYVAAEETLEKATAAEMLPRERRSLGFGILACTNAVGDMASSLYVGYLLEVGQGQIGFLMAAATGLVGTLWLGWRMVFQRRNLG